MGWEVGGGVLRRDNETGTEWDGTVASGDLAGRHVKEDEIKEKVTSMLHIRKLGLI